MSRRRNNEGEPSIYGGIKLKKGRRFIKKLREGYNISQEIETDNRQPDPQTLLESIRSWTKTEPMVSPKRNPDIF
jgi:hypothetical protein